MTKNNYLDNEEIYIELCHWKFKMYVYDDKNIKATDKLGEAIFLTTEGMSRNVKFHMYTWKEDMIGNGIESMIKGLFNFNEQEYMNPHSYISQSAENAFLQTKEKEDRQLLATYKTFLGHYKDDMEEEGFIQTPADTQYVQDMVDTTKKIEASIERNKLRRKLLKQRREMSPLAHLVYGEDIIDKIDDEISLTETFYNSSVVEYKDRGRFMILVQAIKEELGISNEHSLTIGDVVEYLSEKRKFHVVDGMMNNSYVDITYMKYNGDDYVDIKWQTEDFE